MQRKLFEQHASSAKECKAITTLDKQNLHDKDDISNHLTSLLMKDYQFWLWAKDAILDFEAAQAPMLESIALRDAEYLGQHRICEFKVDTVYSKRMDTVLNPVGTLIDVIHQAARAAKATVLGKGGYDHELKYNDICAIVPIEESHLSAHYKSQEKFLGLDIYTCGDIDLLGAKRYIESQLGARPYDEIHLLRGVREARTGRFIQGLAALDQRTAQLHFFKNSAPLTAHGQHLIADFLYCDPRRINHSEFVFHAFHEALVAAGFPKEEREQFVFAHMFRPQGLTLVMMCGAYHVTIHAWPEFGYSAIDACLFSNKIQGNLLMSSLAEKLESRKPIIYTVPRGAHNAVGKKLESVFNSLLPEPVRRANARMVR